MATPFESTSSTVPLRSLAPAEVHRFLEELLGEDLHARRVLSLANGVLGVLHAASLGIHAIGLGLASALGKDPTSTTKQVDRLLSNTGVSPWTIAASWVPFLVRDRDEIVVALDWTDHDADDQTTCMLSLVTGHGRSTPMVWKTVKKSQLAGHQFDTETEVIDRVHEVLPEKVRVTLLADRGFGDQ